MKILVKHKGTGEFYKGHELWTRQKEDAFDFFTEDDAQYFCHKTDLGDCTIVVHLTRGVHDLELPCHLEET
jgi:hypothetical protein